MLVVKFGGASVATPEKILKVADLIAEMQEARLVVVVSAMANATDQLFELAKQIHSAPSPRELAMLVSVGERVSGALLAMALSRRGREAASFTGSQAGIVTNENYTEARIVDVKPRRLLPVLERGGVAIVAGFQGVSRAGEITTLGRGGSDTTAVALAVALRAPRVEFYKDVQGIFDSDPKRNRQARLMQALSYEEALKIALNGGKVLHHRSIRLAQKNGVQMAVRSFLQASSVGTVVGEGSGLSENLGYEDDVCATTRI